MLVHHSKLSKHGPDNTCMIGEISELEWGGFPEFVEVIGDRETRVFGPCSPIMNGDEIGGYLYPQFNQKLDPLCEVHILND